MEARGREINQQARVIGGESALLYIPRCVLLDVSRHKNRNSFFFFPANALAVCSLNAGRAAWTCAEGAGLFTSFRGEKFTIGSGRWWFPGFSLRLELLPRTAPIM